jgi:8-oxo-dGTP diphosphatase
MIQKKKQEVHVAVDNCIFTVDEGRLHVLLIQMKKEPFDYAWALPGGLMAHGETLDGAAARILEQQTGVRDVYLEQLYTFDDKTRDPDGRVLSVAYVSLIPSEGLALETTDKYRAVSFWDCEKLPPRLAYDHAEILDYARRRIAAKIQYTNCMWSLLPEKFTLSELQAAYETVLNRPLDKRNFRKKILSLGLVKALGEKSTGARHRPAMLYRFQSRKPEPVEVF